MDLEGKVLYNGPLSRENAYRTVKRAVPCLDDIKHIDKLSISSVDLYVYSVGELRIGSDFLPGDIVQIEEVKPFLKRKGDATYFGDELVHCLFDNYFLKAIISAKDDLLFEEKFALLSRSVDYDPLGRVTHDGRPYRVVSDPSLKPRKDDWYHYLLSALKGRVKKVMGLTGKNPSLTFPEFKIYVPESGIRMFVSSVESAEQLKGKRAEQDLLELIL